MLKHYCVSVEGIDKSGKGLVRQYLNILGKYKYVLMDRGLMSNIAYSAMNGRNYQYDLSAYTNWTIVYLTVNKEDWEVRCKLSNEKEIDYNVHSATFATVAKELDKAGIPILVYDTSTYTPYAIAKDIIKYMEDREKEDNMQTESSQSDESPIS